MAYRVLIVEDNPDQMDLIRIEFLRAGGKYEPVFAASGRECLERALNEPFDAIILDYKLPDMSGLEVLRRLKEADFQEPVTIVTGQGDERVAVEAMRSGAADYIIKEPNYFRNLPKQIASQIDRFRLQQQLHEKEEFLRTIVEKANDFIFTLDRKLTFRFMNPQVTHLGFQPEELMGRHFAELLNPRTDYSAELNELRRKPAGKNYVFDFVEKDGSIHNFIVSFQRISENGKSDHYILGIAKDVSETLHLHRLIQESKNKLQALFDSITDYIIVMDRDKVVRMANRKAAALRQRTPDKILGMKCFEVFGEGAECRNCPFERTWKARQPETMEMTRGNRVFQVWTYPMFDLKGQLQHIIEYSRDVTEQKNIERKLIQSEKLATIGLLASGVAHELRNPLNIIETARYYIEDILGEDHEEIKSKLGIIKRNVQRASNIINNLLEFSRHSVRDREEIDVNQLIDKTLSLIEKDLYSQNIQVVKLYQRIPRAYMGLDSLKQVFLNIIINAVQAMPDGGKLTISTGVTEERWIRVDFSDTGHGIPEEHLKDIFTPFFTTKETGKGTGLGMYVSHSIIQREGGQISVSSQVNQGTTFTVRIPIARREK